MVWNNLLVTHLKVDKDPELMKQIAFYCEQFDMADSVGFYEAAQQAFGSITNPVKRYLRTPNHIDNCLRTQNFQEAKRAYEEMLKGVGRIKRGMDGDRHSLDPSVRPDGSSENLCLLLESLLVKAAHYLNKFHMQYDHDIRSAPFFETGATSQTQGFMAANARGLAFSLAVARFFKGDSAEDIEDYVNGWC